MDWILFWQIAAPIIGLLGIGATVFLVLWARREKVEITYTNMFVQLKTNEATGIQFEYWFSLIYVRGTRDHYVSKIFIEFNKHPWKKLSASFAMPISICKGIGNLDTPVKLELGKPTQFGHDDFFPARRAISEEEQKEFDSLVQKLWHRYEIGWKDTYGKTHWKTIHQLKEIEKRDIL